MSNQDPRHDEAAEAALQRPKPGTPEHKEWLRAKARENWRKRAERIAADPEAKDRERLRKKARNYEARQRRRVGILPLPIGQRVPKEQ